MAKWHGIHKKEKHVHNFQPTTFFGKYLFDQCGCGQYREKEKQVGLESVDVHLKELMKKEEFKKAYLAERKKLQAEIDKLKGRTMTVMEPCPFCKRDGDDNCFSCRGTGEVRVIYPVNEIRKKLLREGYRKSQPNWCSKHQRVHQERKHISCRYPNDKEEPYTEEDFKAMDRLCESEKNKGKVFTNVKECIRYLRKLCEHKHKWDKQNIVGNDYILFVKVCSKCHTVETELVRT